jgi:hypothetical protein
MRSPCYLCACVSPLMLLGNGPSVFVCVSLCPVQILSFSMRFVSYQRKVGDQFFPKLLVFIVFTLYVYNDASNRCISVEW